ncbi:hypothetical protein [Chitinophaga sp. YR627]|uniref:hypothetical protein n=1 Tax=Chitinophaga sp. YR627 TaxID=1881041 RepID=UPI0011603483|nr:hypothetical protein [Chitinophaga sp. YR627]
MMNKLPVILLILLSACAQPSLQPVMVAKKMFQVNADEKFINAHSTGDYRGSPSGRDLPADMQRSFLLLQQRDETSTVALNLRQGNLIADKYLFFTKDSGSWKLSGIGTPTLARLNVRKLQAMQALSPAAIDSTLREAQQYTDPEYKTREEFDFIVNSLQLKLAPDDTLIAHFHKYRPAFDSLLIAAKQALRQPYDEYNSLVNTKTPAYRPLLISNISTGGFLPKECIDFHILYDQVGYLYTPDEKYLPELRPDKVMMVRKLGRGWYLYKVAIYL